MGGFLDEPPALTVVGSGIQIGRDLTPGARNCIARADKVLFLAADIVAERAIKELNPSAESLHTHYADGKIRMQTYGEMIDRVMGLVRDGNTVCLVSYGHPGFFGYPMHESVRRARTEGYRALMVPGVSSLDCLLADLGIDPGAAGLTVRDASDFLLRPRVSDLTCDLVLLQIAATGDPSYKKTFGRSGLRMLVGTLSELYGAEHDVVLYEAAEYPIGNPRIEHMPVSAVVRAKLGTGSTLYVPPKGQSKIDESVWKRLNLEPNGLSKRKSKAR